MADLGKIKGSISVAVFKTPNRCMECPLKHMDEEGFAWCGHEDGPMPLVVQDDERHSDCPLMDFGYEYDVTVDEQNTDNG